MNFGVGWCARHRHRHRCISTPGTIRSEEIRTPKELYCDVVCGVCVPRARLLLEAWWVANRELYSTPGMKTHFTYLQIGNKKQQNTTF